MTEPLSPTPVAIIGIGCLYPLAGDSARYWANILDRVDVIGDVPPDRWNPADYHDADPKKPDHTYARRGGFLEPTDFPPLDFGISPNSLEGIDATQLLGLLVARQALEDAGYGAGRDFDRSRTGVILGVTGTQQLVIPLGARLGHPIWRKALKDASVPDDVAEDVVQRISDGYVPWIEDSFPGLLGNVAAGRIANRLDLGGTNCVVDAACASSLSAIHLGLLELSAGRTDMILTGGFDVFNDIFMYMCFSKTPALSPSGDARPFDSSADGTILGEGLGCVVLKRLADAERDGDKIYAVIKAIGTSSDGKGQAIYAPNPAGQVKALKRAYELAGVTPDTVELVEAHGTGTKAGDAAEVAALTEVYRATGKAGSWCALGSVKSQLGHTKAAAGASGLIKAALALHHKVLPPTIKVSQPIDALQSSPLYVNTEKRPWLPSTHPRRAGVSAFGFGGSNFHCVLEEYRRESTEIDWDGQVQLLAFSAGTDVELWQQVDSLPADPSWDELRRQAARSRQRFRADQAHRLVLVLENGKSDLSRLLDSCRKVRGQKRGTVPDGACYASGPVPGQLAVLFPGQGSQYVGMLRDLACQFPQLQRVLGEANDLGDGRRLGDFLYPQPVFHDDARQQQEGALRSTDIAQPALGAINLGALRVLDHFGIQADAFAGHSYGELVALCAAGWYDENTLHHVSRQRGCLMAQAAGGAMLAVAASLDQVEALQRQESLNLSIANKNAPSQIVLSGPEAEIARAVDCCGRAGFRCTKLPVSAAFHSPLVASARDRFHEMLGHIDLVVGATPVFANKTGQAYPRDPVQARQLLADQLASPVEFMAQIQNLYGSGVRTFVEVGPGNKLTGLVDSILGQQDHVAIALDASSGRRGGDFDLARLLAQLAVLGYPVALERWDAGIAAQAPAKKPALTVPIRGGNHVRPRPSRPPVERRLIPANHQEAVTVQRNGAQEPVPPPAPPPALDTGSRQQALKVTQDSLLTLQKLGEQTARLHAQFLEGQDRALQAMQSLLEQQRQLFGLAGSVPPVRAEAITKPLVVESMRAIPPVAEAVVPVVAAVAAPVADAPRSPSAAIAETLLAVVAEKTGYPVDTLQLDMELDADLGIDSIKRVEIFSAIQDQLPRAPAIKPEHLGTLRTLRQVVDFLGQGSAAPPLNGKPISPAPAKEPSQAAAVLLATVAEKTGYPVETLQLDMELDADLGIDSIKRVEIFSAIQEQLPQAPAIKPEHLGTLRTLRQVAEFLAGNDALADKTSAEPAARHPDRSPAGPQDSPRTQQEVRPPAAPDRLLELQRYAVVPSELPGPRLRLPLDGEVWITRDDSGLADGVAARLEALGLSAQLINPGIVPDVPERLAGLVIVGSTSTTDAGLRNAFLWVQRLGPALQRAQPAIVVTVSRLDGLFGVNGLAGDSDPTSGGLAGLAKTVVQEWPGVKCKAIDVDSSWVDVDEAALAIADEIFLDGPVEVGLSASGRATLRVEESPFTDHSGVLPLAAGDVVVVTGGGRGVTAAAALALAHACQPTLVLLGRTPAPGPEPDWLIPLASEAEIKQALAVRANGQGTPRKIEEQYRSLAAARELRENLQRIEKAGGKVIYRAVDVSNPTAVRQVMADIRRPYGPIRGLIHGAGVLADRRIEDKTLDQFDQVYATKVAGLRALLDDLPAAELKALVLFSSITARRGRAGQVDYAVANEVLNKLAQREARRRPSCKVVSLNWGPWDGGMVTPSLKRVFQQEGIGLIPLEQGAHHLLRELSAPPGPVEVVVLAQSAAIAVADAAVSNGAGASTALERVVSVAEMPILRSHVIAGRAVVPMALMVEWLAHAALHRMPGLQFAGLDDLRVLKGIRLAENETERIQVLAGKVMREADGYHVPLELRGVHQNGRDALHASATALLAERPPANQERCPSLAGNRADLGVAEIYDTILFHGDDLQAIEALECLMPAGISAWVRSGSLPKDWLRQPLRGGWVAEPLVLDCAFQLMSIWCQQMHGAVSLPCRGSRYRQYRRSFPADGARIVCRVTRVAGQQVEADLWFLDTAGGVIARLDGYECVLDPSLNQAFRQNRLEAAPAI